MMMKMLLFLVLVAVSVITAEQEYDRHQVLSVRPKVSRDVEEVAKLEEEMELDFWHYPRTWNDSFHIRVSPEKLAPFLAKLRHLDVDVSVLIDNVQTHVDRERAEMRLKRSTKASPRIIELYQYHDLEDIEHHVSTLTSRGDVSVSVTELQPDTFQQRHLQLVHIFTTTGNPNKESIFVDCGIHAREWITPAFCLYLIDMLMLDEGGMASMFDWYVIPVANPDGYHYTRNENRMWRKNRNDNRGGNTCKGVDLNRNFDYQWGGASANTCSDTYQGTSPASEPETQAIKSAVEMAGNVVAYLNVHAYSQFWMVPWGYTKEHFDPEDKDEMNHVGEIAAHAIHQRYNTTYHVGTPSDLLSYTASGGSYDWAKGMAGVPYSFALELRDTGSYGFLLPVSLIEPTVKETFDGFKAMADYLYMYSR